MHSTMGSRQIGWCLAMVLLLWGCGSQEFESKAALMAYLRDPGNGYHLTEHVNGVDYALTYRPTDLLVTQSLSANSSKEEIDSLKTVFGDQLYFNLSISKAGKEVLNTFAGNRRQFGAMVNQLAFGLSNKVQLLTAKRDTIAMISHLYPRLYGMGGGNTILMAFPRDERLFKGETFQLSVTDLGLGGGKLNFEFKSKAIANEPKIKQP
ncbi:MAG: hypothetical protein AAGF77_06930 [Bacteroidota bacterium]